MHGTDHIEVARAQAMLGGLLLADGDYPAAEKALQAAAATQRRDLPPAHPQQAVTLTRLAECLLRLGKDAEAARCAEAVLAAMDPAKAANSPTRRNMLVLLGSVRWQLGELEASASAFEAVVGIESRTLGAEHRETAMTRLLLARVRLDQGREHAAEAEASASATIEALGESEPLLASVLVVHAEARSLAGRGDDAEGDLQRALRICRQPDQRGVAFAKAQVDVGEYLLAHGRAGEAEPVLRASLELLAKDHPQDRCRWLAASALGGALVELGRHAEAEPLLLQANEGLPPVLPQPDSRVRRRTVQRLVSLYEGWGKPEAAASWRARL